MQHLSLNGYFDDHDKARYTDTVREIAYGSECGLTELLLFIIDLAENDKAENDRIHTYPDEIAALRAALKEIQ